MPTPEQILERAYKRASSHLNKPIIKNSDVQKRIEIVCRDISNRACVRLLLACLSSKASNINIDIRKPYTEIGGIDCYSGRSCDEEYIGPFVVKHQLPCNPTTAFLTPALRNIKATLIPELDLVGRPRSLYQTTLQLLTDVHTGKVSAEDALAEAVRCLLILRDERRQRIEMLLDELSSATDAIPLSTEAIIKLIQQHIECKYSSRLPVLVVAAAYQAASAYIGERVLPLEAHNAADEQTGVFGDLEITLIDDNAVITSYEMKLKRVTRGDVERALQKIVNAGKKVHHYVFITTDIIEKEVQDYAISLYDVTGGIEFVILDCLGFLRHFLHLFHRLRMKFLDSYQELVLAEPDSAVGQPLKEAFLALRQAAIISD